MVTDIKMNSKEFRIHGKEMVDYICDYLETVSDRRVISSVEPGYLAPILPAEAPKEGEEWNKIMSDIDDKIMPGTGHTRALVWIIRKDNF